jgi:hypothetical protein
VIPCYVESFDGRLVNNWRLDERWEIVKDGDKRLLIGKEHIWAELLRGEDWTNYSFKVHLKILRGVVHLNYRLSEEGRYFIGVGQEGLYLKKETPWGEFFDLANNDAHHDPETWHDIEIVGDEDRIQVFVDKRLEIDFTDEDPLHEGSIAFESLEDSYVQIDAMSVELIAGKALPDLTLALVNPPSSPIKWIMPSPPQANKMTTISIVVKNVGIVPVEDSFDTELYVDGIHEKTWRFSSNLEEEDEYHSKQSLMPGASITYDYADTFSKGKHTFKWVVDVKNEITESDESIQSNELETNVIFLEAMDLPDLIVDDIWNEGPLVVGQNVTWKIRIKNIGKTAVSGSFMTSLKANGVQFGAFWLNYLGAGDVETFKTTQYSGYAGTETITGTVDVSNVVTEKDETNNTKDKQFTTGFVDLAVQNLVVKPKNPNVCKDIEISFTIKNNGPGAATKTFQIYVYPGKVSSSLTQPVTLTIPTNKLPLTAGQSVSLQHKFTPLYAGDYNVWIKVDTTSVYKEKNTQNNTLTTKIQVAGMLNGRLLDSRTNITAEEMQCYIEKDPSLEWFRKKVALTALNEVKIKPTLCGDDARNKYGASGAWCSEFAAWVLRKSGMKNIRYCSAHFMFCWNYVYLDEVTLNKELVKLFDRNGNRFKWRLKNQVNPQTSEVGDYLSMMTNGKKKNHAGITVAITKDNKWIWTVEGNAGNCVWMGRRPYFQDGKNLDQNIDGFGKLDSNLF